MLYVIQAYRPATSWVHYTTSCNTQSSSLEDGRNNRPKHVELIGIINKLLLLHLVGCLYYVWMCQLEHINCLYWKISLPTLMLFLSTNTSDFHFSQCSDTGTLWKGNPSLERTQYLQVFRFCSDPVY